MGTRRDFFRTVLGALAGVVVAPAVVRAAAPARGYLNREAYMRSGALVYDQGDANAWIGQPSAHTIRTRWRVVQSDTFGPTGSNVLTKDLRGTWIPLQDALAAWERGA